MTDYNTGYDAAGMGGTSYNVVSATFADAGDAQRVVDWLRDQGAPESAISVAARRSDDYADATDADDMDEAADAGRGALAGVGIGAGVGALFGLAAAAIPGVGPFVTAGALTNVLGAAGGAAVSGAIVGGSSGGLAGALTNWGMNESESKHYAGEVERGGTYVGVDLTRANLGREAVLDAFRRFHGRTYGY